jgi:CBS domain-containing protein/anti-sigma regulatory factor (Ser/Thr protein kinase)
MDDYADLSLVSELVYQLKARDAMRRDLISCGPDSTLRDVQGILRANQISGVPVIQGDSLVGIVSIEDILKALDSGYIEERVEKWMTRKVVTVQADTPLNRAVDCFERYHFGRLPVVDRDGRPVGIITPEDIVYRLMVELTRIAEDIERRHQELQARVGELDLQAATVKREFFIRAGDYENAGASSSALKAELHRRGVEPSVARRAAIALYEAETNIIIHSIGGRIAFEVSGQKMTAEAVDWGPGIPDLELAMTPGYSTASEFVRALGFGAGMGLSNIRRCADRFHIESVPNRGTTLRIEVDLKKIETSDDTDRADSTPGAADHPPDGAVR